MFAKHKINDDFRRDDYKEFLELITLFLGAISHRGIRFRVPRAFDWPDGWKSQYIVSKYIYLVNR